MGDITLATVLQESFTRFATRVALTDGERTLTYAELDDSSRRVAEGLRELAVGRGERVACVASNRIEHVVTMIAAWRLGAVHVGLDVDSGATELSNVLSTTAACVIVIESPPDQSGACLEHRVKTAPGTRLVGVGAPLQREQLVLTDRGIFLDGQLLGGALSTATIAPADPAVLFVSSGTTGVPKVTVGFHGNLSQRWSRLGTWLSFSPEDVHLAHLPLAHGFGMMMTVSALLTGGRVVLLSSFTAERALNAIVRERVTVFNGAPTHFRLLISRRDPRRHDLRSLRSAVGTATAFPPSLIEAIRSDLGMRFTYMYGSSEGVGVATFDADDIRLGSVGRPAPGSVTIVDTERNTVAIGDVGEIAFSRRMFPVTFWSPTATEATLHLAGDWFYSGDLGRLDADGRLYILGRIKHQIDRGGLKVDPTEVERALHHCPGVVDVAVLGVPNPVLGESICACVVSAAGVAVELPRLRAQLRNELASHKLPELLCVLEQIPRTVMGKVDLAALRKLTRDLPLQAASTP